MRTAELSGLTFACLEGCGYCCTFPPEATSLEQARLRARLAPRALPITIGDDGRSHLALHNKCGACTLLERRACTVYDLRPAHCRYFPFHVHFAEQPEVYVNYTCRGVERAPGGDLSDAFAAAVLAHVKPETLRRHDEEARAAYGEFKRNARRADAWGDADAVVADALAAGNALFTRDGVDVLAKRAGLDNEADSLHALALEPFGADDVTKRPFHLAPDLRWLTFARDGPDALHVLEMDERGALTPTAQVSGVATWKDIAPDLADGLLSVLARLTTRRLFVGSVYGLVDDEDYERTVEEAAHERLADLVIDLALRARLLTALGTRSDRLVDEVARFYDSTFLDTPTIGGFL